jgi:hypothetical protein
MFGLDCDNERVEMARIIVHWRRARKRIEEKEGVDPRCFTGMMLWLP